MQNSQLTYFHILGVLPHATDEEVRQSYYRLAHNWHPDKNKHKNKKLVEQRFKMINRAYVHLKTKPQREAYARFIKQRIMRERAMVARNAVTTTKPPVARTQNKKRTSGFLVLLKEVLWPFVPAQNLSKAPMTQEAHYG